MKKYKHKTNGSTMTFKDGCMRIESLVIEGTPNLEFWEDVTEERDYEILCLKDKYRVIQVRKDWNLSTSTLKYFLNDPSVYISSIKRLSDGEIFSVGDSAKTKTSKGHHKIEKFEVKQKVSSTTVYDGINRIWVKWDKDSGGNWLDKIEHYREPLFKTTDGVEIFEDDVYFVPQYFGDWYEGVLSFEACEKVATDNSKTFSTREKAEEFILFNRPNLSLNEVFSIYPQLKKKEPFVNTDHAERLINLAKSKTK